MKTNLLIAMTVGLVACGNKTAGTPTGDMASNSTATDMSTASAPHIRTGMVSIVSTHPLAMTSLQNTTLASAEFDDFSGATAATLTTSTFGSCVLTNITKAGVVGTPSTRSAGTINVTGGNKALALTVSGTAYTAITDSANSLWSGGEPISVVAAGADVPAFSIQIVAPSEVVMTAPAPPAAGQSLSISTNSDMQLTWSGGASGAKVHARLSLNVFTPTLYSQSLDCYYDATSGSGTIPTTALKALKTGGAGTLLIEGGGVNVQNAVMAGDYLVTIALTSPAVFSNGGNASVGFTLQ
jgi:hypothetical protein